MISQPWTEREIDYVKQMYDTIPVTKIATTIGRTYKSTEYQIKKMGLRKTVSISYNAMQIKKQLVQQMLQSARKMAKRMSKQKMQRELCATCFWPIHDQAIGVCAYANNCEKWRAMTT